MPISGFFNNLYLVSCLQFLIFTNIAVMDLSKYEKVWQLQIEPQDESYAAAVVKFTDGYGLINSKDQILMRFDDIETFGNYGGFVEVNEKWGFLDRQGKWLIEPQFDKTWYLSYPDDDLKALAIVGIEGEEDEEDYLYLINRKGDKLVKFEEMRKFDADRGGFAGIDNKWGYLDIYGNWKIKPIFQDHPYDLFRGIELMNAEGKFYYVTKYGDILGNRSFDDGFYFKYFTAYGKENEEFGIGTVKVADLWGFIDVEGNWLMKPQFDDVVLTTDVIDGGFPYVSLKNGGAGYLKRDMSTGKFYIKWETDPHPYTPEEIQTNLQKETLKVTTITGVHKYLPDSSNKWRKIEDKASIVLIRDKENPFDPNAVVVALAEDYFANPDNFDLRNILGFIPKKDNSEIAKLLDAGKPLEVKINYIKDFGNPNERIGISIFKV